jgi:hypothetical protein
MPDSSANLIRSAGNSYPEILSWRIFQGNNFSPALRIFFQKSCELFSASALSAEIPAVAGTTIC